MGTAIVDNSKMVRATNHITDLHNYLKDYPKLQFFKVKYRKAYRSVPYQNLDEEFVVKVSGNMFMFLEQKKNYKITGSGLIPTEYSKTDHRFKIVLHEIVPMNAIINLTKED